MSKQRTITLTGRPPVRINEDDWPVIASASDKTWDNQYEFQANCTWSWWLKVRQHEDGRTIVYGGYQHTTQYQGGREYLTRSGRLLGEDATADTICKTIRSVSEDLASAEADDDYTERWKTLARECIADMPAETI